MLLWSSLSSWVQRSNLNQFKHPQFSQSPAHSSRPSTTWPFLVQVHQPLAATGWISKIDRSKAIGLYTLRTVTKKEHSITWLYEIQKDQTACSCFKQGSVSHTSTKHPMRLHCIATNSWGQVPSEFSRANAAAEAVKQIQKGKENPWGQRVVPQQKPRSGT